MPKGIDKAFQMWYSISMASKEQRKIYYQEHKTEISAYNKLYYQATREKRKVQHLRSSIDYYREHRDEILQKKRKLEKPKQTKEERKAYIRDYERRFRLEVLAHYGGGLPSCIVCGENRLPCLTIDHINNNGAEHRREIKNTSIYKWLKRNNYPSGYQTLCMNCQWVKRADNLSVYLQNLKN